MHAHRFQAELTPTQKTWAAQAAGGNRWVYNEGRKFCIEAYKKDGSYPGYVALAKKLTEWRAEHDWLKKGASDAQQQSLIDLDNGYKRFFKKLGKFPTKKSWKKSPAVLRFPNGANVNLSKLSKKDSTINLPKLGQVRFRQSQPVLGRIRSVTLKRDRVFNWYVIILTDYSAPSPVVPESAGKAVGIDMGVARTATLSDGTSFNVPAPTKKDEAHLARLQRRLSRRQRDSKRYGRARLAVAKFHLKWQDRRKDILHKQSSRIVLENQEVYVEALKVKNMTARCKGKGRAAKSGLNKSILRQGWGMFHEMLAYKSARKDGNVFGKENPAFTSQECRKCHHIDPGNRLSQDVFLCLKCGHKENADFNASHNILVAGQATTARGRIVRPVVGGTSVRSRLAVRLKREPTGVSVV